MRRILRKAKTAKSKVRRGMRRMRMEKVVSRFIRELGNMTNLVSLGVYADDPDWIFSGLSGSINEESGDEDDDAFEASLAKAKEDQGEQHVGYI